jgi:outer membrane protein assembly factor BamB
MICVLPLSEPVLSADVPAANPISYAVADTWKLGGDGGWDYVTIDSAAKRVYITRSTHTIAIDSTSGKIVGDIPDNGRSHGVAIVPRLNRGFITDGQHGEVIVFDTNTFQTLGRIKAADDADGIIYDEADDRLLVVCGDAGELVAIQPDLDPKTGKSEPPLDLGGKPEFLAADGKGKAFINLTDKDQVAEVNVKAMKVLAHWPTAPGGQPVGMSMDRDKGRLFIGCRRPAKMIVMSAEDGKVLADLPIGNGVDATAFNNGTALDSCGDGTLVAIRETSPDKYEVVQTLKTAVGARTMGVDQATGTIYLPTAEMAPATAPAADGRPPRPRPIAGTFKILVAQPGGK